MKKKKINAIDNVVSVILGLLILSAMAYILINYIRSGKKEEGNVEVPGVSDEFIAEEKKDETKEYVVKKGDSLWKIGLANYGDGYRWTQIWQLNKTQIKNPDLIYPGMKLILP